MNSFTQMKELEAKSEVINDSLWYVNPRDVAALIEATHQAAMEDFKELVTKLAVGVDQQGRQWVELKDLIIALSPQEPLTDKE